MDEKPEISVIITSYNARETIESTFKSLEEQKTSESFEVILIDSSADGSADIVESKFPHVKIHRFSERKFCGSARNIGISKAEGRIITFIDADCLAEPNWIEEILKAHESPHIAIGGAIGNANPESYVGWAAYFSELSKWMPGTRHQWMDDIGGGMMSYKKEVFDKYGDFIEGAYSSDSDFHWRLGKNGHRLWFVPSILISHHNIEEIGTFLKHEVFHGQHFAKVRIQGEAFSIWKRLFYVILSPLVALKIFRRSLSTTLRTGIT